MSRIKFVDILAVIVSLVPFAFFFLYQDSLADRVPIHWNARGEANGWADRDQVPIFLGIMAIAGLAVYLLLRFVKKFDPKRTAQLNEGIALKIGVGIVLFMAAINVLILLPTTSKLNITTIVFILVSLLFTFLGNLMYNIKPNYFIGIRLPWTLEDEDNWKHTHRLAGVVWFIGGIVCAVMTLLVDSKILVPAFLALTMLLVLIPSIYSFVLFRKAKREG